MNHQKNAYETLRTHADSLVSRLILKTEWRDRHPDYGLFAFERDRDQWEQQPDTWTPSGNSTFDPNDLMPHTSDVLSAELFCALMLVALSAYENAQNHKCQSDTGDK